MVPHRVAASPWVIDTRELGRRPGLMRTYRRRVTLPERLGLDVIAVPAGTEVDVDVRLESVVEGVLASGAVVAALSGECSRCLEDIHDEVRVEFSELYAYPDSATDETTDADEVSRLDGDRVDLEPVVRDAIVLALPQAPLCRPDCPGLCAECGGRWAVLGPDHHHERIDPRWAGLRERLAGSDGRSVDARDREES